MIELYSENIISGNTKENYIFAFCNASDNIEFWDKYIDYQFDLLDTISSEKNVIVDIEKSYKILFEDEGSDDEKFIYSLNNVLTIFSKCIYDNNAYVAYIRKEEFTYNDDIMMAMFVRFNPYEKSVKKKGIQIHIAIHRNLIKFMLNDKSLPGMSLELHKFSCRAINYLFPEDTERYMGFFPLKKMEEKFIEMVINEDLNLYTFSSKTNGNKVEINVDKYNEKEQKIIDKDIDKFLLYENASCQNCIMISIGINVMDWIDQNTPKNRNT